MPGRFHGPDFIFSPDPDQLDNIQQVVQGIGAVPELVLFPEAGGHRRKQEFIHVRAGYGDIAGGSGGDVRPPSPKKPDRLQEMLSAVSFIQETVSC